MKYGDCTTFQDKLDWYTGVYAWRRARLGASHEVRTSPPDPEGHWFAADMVDKAERLLRDKIDDKQAARTKQRDEQMLAEARRVKDTWARQHGYGNFEDYQHRHGRDDVDAACNVTRSLIAAAVIKGEEAFAEPAERDPKAMLKALGATAKQPDYSPEAMRRARIALGIDTPAPAAAAE